MFTSIVLAVLTSTSDSKPCFEYNIHSMKEFLFNYTVQDLTAWFEQEGIRSFHLSQLLEWLFEKKVSRIASMTNLSVSLREKLEKSFDLDSLQLVRIQESDDKETFKFLWKLRCGRLVESVLILSDERRTVCVSSQVGCPARCAFCASGQKGFFRNLECHEIVSQVYLIDQWLHQKGERVSHVVYMGMGEPFRNYETVVKSIRMLIDPKMMHLSQRRITVSTVGVVESILRFATEEFRVNLVLSLHAPNQKIRQRIIPYAREYALDDIMKAMDHYFQKTKRDVTYEYILLAGINDGEEQAKELVELLKFKQCSVNLIPYNPVAGIRLKKPTPQSIACFRDILSEGSIINTCRYTKGDDIAAACGQLALQEDEAICF